MATPTRPFESGGFYHIYNRGNHRQPIFHDSSDYAYFLEKLSDNCKKYDVGIHAYCLMKNHYHLLLRQNGETGITPSMLSTTVSVVKRFNNKYGTVGRLFQERFRHIPITSGEQLLQVSKYIHLNPGEFTDFSKYPWSSYKEYFSESPGICDPEPVLLALRDYGGSYAAFATPGVDQLSYPRGSERGGI